jgi:hypothetical protein
MIFDMLNDIITECYYAECCYAECHYADCRVAEQKARAFVATSQLEFYCVQNVIYPQTLNYPRVVLLLQTL